MDGSDSRRLQYAALIESNIESMEGTQETVPVLRVLQVRGSEAVRTTQGSTNEMGVIPAYSL
jgi:hypothetical protein